MVRSELQLPAEYSPSASSAPYFNYSKGDFILDLRRHNASEDDVTQTEQDAEEVKMPVRHRQKSTFVIC